jgi:sugar-specific transcriptional regulator TrmB
MAQTVGKLLSELNFSPKERAVYLAILELGEAPVSPIARRAKVNRGTAYDILRSLISKGLVAKSEKAKKLNYSALGIEGLEAYLSAQRAEWDSKMDILKELRPEFVSLLGSAGIKPTVRFFEGKMGLKEVFLDQIRGDHKEILTYSIASKIIETFGGYIKTYTGQKSRTGIVTKLIATDEPELDQYLKTHYGAQSERLFQVKRVPSAEFPFESEINIYGDKVALISLGAKEPTAVIIESPTLAKSQRLIFELLWNRL